MYMELSLCSGYLSPDKDFYRSLCPSNARAIIDTRNRIIHAYDNVQPVFLWSLVIRHIPELKKDIERIIVEYEERYNRKNNYYCPLNH